MMNKGLVSPVGVCILPEPGDNAARSVSYSSYLQDILSHAGVCCATLELNDLGQALPDLKVLLTIGETKIDDETCESLSEWVRQGGFWISVGGTCGLDDLFGVAVEGPAYSSWGGGLGKLGEGYLQPVIESHPVLAHLEIPLHFFGGLPARANGSKILASVLDAHQRPTERVAVTESNCGLGSAMFIAVDITGTVVRIQQGIGVMRDGVAAPDGTASIDDRVLKSDDGAVLDWIFDRQPVEGTPGFSAFLQPVADQWRELLLRAVFYAATESRVQLPVLWLYPRNLPALAHISHDTDGNDSACGQSMLKVLNQAGINSTWCVLPPGYPAELISKIEEAGHELAMHYDTMSEGTVFSEEEFGMQWLTLVDIFDGKRPLSNKNHYLRWEGDMEFFEWCQSKGILLDQSKGASKTGEAGFNFGACNPYFPVKRDGTVVDVLEMPTITQDLEVFAPRTLVEPMLRANLKHHGVLHLLFHPAHIEKPGVADALLEAVQKAKDAGMEWWRACDYSAWERARRRVQWIGYTAENAGVKTGLRCEEPLKDATVMWLSPEGSRMLVNGGQVQSHEVQRWGFRFRSVVTDIAENSEQVIEIGI